MSEGTMSVRPFAVITTRLPPAICGIGAHSALLRREWPGRARPVEFLVVGDAARANPICEGDRITQFDGNGSKLSYSLDRLGAADVVLHYAARAYHRYGCPLWLPNVLAQWKRKFRDGRLLVFVHEAPGDIPFPSRHYWLAKVDSWILRRLASTADVVVTNTEHHRRKLQRISGRENIRFVPVGSNIENLRDEWPPRAQTEFVLLGLSFGRAQTLRLFEKQLQRWKTEGKLTALHIIGPGDDGFTGAAIRHGALTSAEVARVLRSTRFALTNVNPETWSKSGAFMACAAHGCTPVMLHARPKSGPLSCAASSDEVETVTELELDRRAADLRVWYDENAAWPIVAARLRQLLEGSAR